VGGRSVHRAEQEQARKGNVPVFKREGEKPKLSPSSTRQETRTMSTDNATSSSPKIAIITGASRGLGRSTALGLARRGVDSIITYHANRAEADKVVAAIGEMGRKAVALQLDTGAVESFDLFVRKAREALKDLGAERFDYLVNNAGTSHHNAIERTTEQELDALYNVHFKGVFFLTQKLLPLIHDGGRVVNLSTGLTRMTIPGSAAYASMKGAVEVLTRYLAKELGARGIAVNAVAPGAIATDFSGGMVRDNPDLARRVAEMTALGRVGQPEDIGPMIAALLSQDNRWVNAQRIEVSGGMGL
jgi:NAD(P)-dependent dehydrogenase (short-subunit alcohol dehydrogenase family)